MRTLVDLELPRPNGRLRIPVISTAGKERAIQGAEPDLVAVDEMVEPLRSLIGDGPWTGTARELVEQLGDGSWPAAPEALGKFLSKSRVRERFLHEHRIEISRPPRQPDARLIQIASAA